MAYMEMFGNCTHGNTTEFLRHSVHTYTMLHQSNWHSPQKYQGEIQSYSVENSCQQYYFAKYVHNLIVKSIILINHKNYFIIIVRLIHQLCHLKEVN